MNRLGLNLNVSGDAEEGRMRTRPPVIGRAGEGPDGGEHLREYLDALSAATAKVTARRPLRSAEMLANKYIEARGEKPEKQLKTVDSPIDTDVSQESLSELFNIHEVDELFLMEDDSKKVEIAVEPQTSHELEMMEENTPSDEVEEGDTSSSSTEEISSSVNEISESQSSHKTYDEYSQDFETSSSIDDSPRSYTKKKMKSVFVQTLPRVQQSNGDFFFLRNCIAVNPDYLSELASREPNSLALNELMKGQLRVLKNVYSAQRNWYLSTLSALDSD